METKGDIAVIGLGVMGQNLILNMDDHGYTVVAYNRSVSKVDEFLANAAKNTKVIAAHSISEMINKLKTPRKIMLMIKAGEPVDSEIEKLLPYLSSGDCIIDGGNSHFTDTIRRTMFLEKKGFFFIGAGISGGEEGARKGPSIMPGGSTRAWSLVKDIFTAISAKTPDGVPCCDWVGSDGAGHYVKMAHNAIEYGDIQIICEAYHLMKQCIGLSSDQLHEIFTRWNTTELNSYLIEITSNILAYKDSDGIPLIDKILDKAEHKGTGKWFSVNSLDLGVPVTLITEAVYARYLSTLKEERIIASKTLPGPSVTLNEDKLNLIEDIRKALLASKIISYTQGFMCMREASKEYNWGLDYGNIALLWRGGCIIKSVFLDNIKTAFHKNPELPNLLLDDYFRDVVLNCQNSWRKVIMTAVKHGVPIPSFCSALEFFDGYRSNRLPANLLQAMRDYFGAHTYRRIDAPESQVFHTDWTGYN